MSREPSPRQSSLHNKEESSINCYINGNVLIFTDVVCTGVSILALIDEITKESPNINNIIVATVIHKIKVSKHRSRTKLFEDYLESKSRQKRGYNIIYLALGCIEEIACTHVGDEAECPVFASGLSEISILYETKPQMNDDGKDV